MKIIHKSNIYVALIIGIAILIHGVLDFTSKNKELQIEKQKIEAETALKTANNDRLEKLDKCLEKAELEYEHAFKLNSTEGITPGGESARKWNSTEIHRLTQDTLDSNKELCIKTYK